MKMAQQAKSKKVTGDCSLRDNGDVGGEEAIGKFILAPLWENIMMFMMVQVI